MLLACLIASFASRPLDRPGPASWRKARRLRLTSGIASPAFSNEASVCAVREQFASGERGGEH
jgi:hypothetical protein